ncbi:hypothetical protein qdsa001_45 [Staphylococcus phage qdsa001]|nr:hypothetical protein qdsa001_45 [Staphylococcus phage qdsa001]QXV86254.1 hypothetical protein [Staphylococcus phage SAPYZU_15]
MTELKVKVGTNKVKTKDVNKISEYLKDTYEKLDMEQSIDFQNRTPYLISDDGIFIAQYLEKANAVGFYKESTVQGEVKQLVHVTPADIEHTTWTIEEDDIVDVYNDELPVGDIIIYFSRSISSELSAYLLPHVSFREYIDGLGLQTLSCIPKIVYTGISKGRRENISFDVLCTVTGDLEFINRDGGWNNDTFTTAERKLQ